jgi:hypothetical protein
MSLFLAQKSILAGKYGLGGQVLCHPLYKHEACAFTWWPEFDGERPRLEVLRRCIHVKSFKIDTAP